MNRTARLLGILSLATATACGGAAATTASSGASSAPTGDTAQGQPQGPPGVSGLIAEVSGRTLQVQGPSSQTAVTYTATTRITETVYATAAAVKVGMCAQARTVPPAGASSAPTAPPTSITATTVTLSQPVAGSCAGGFGGGRGAGGFRPNGGLPRSPRPGGGAGRRFGGGGGGAFGLITSVSATGFTVASIRPAFGATASPAPSPSSVPVQVTTTSATTYTVSRAAGPSAVKVGLCVTARGPADSVGAVTATSLSLRPAVAGACSSGFGFGGSGA